MAMNHPYYKVTVTSVTRGWVYSSTEGVAANPADLVQLVDPLKFNWAFVGEQIPGQLEPFTATVNLAGKTASALPEAQLGDLVTLDVRIGTTGPRLVQQTLRVTAAEATLKATTKDKYPAKLAVALVDTSVDWRARVAPPFTQTQPPLGILIGWAGRFADVGAKIGLSVGCPSSWAVPEEPPLSTTKNWRDQYPDAEEMFTRLAQSHVPAGVPYSFVGVYAAARPSGYDYVGAHAAAAAPWTVPTEPAGPVRALLVAAGRGTASSALPLVFGTLAGVTVLVAVAPILSGPASQVAIPACWLTLPAQARRARDQACNTLQMAGTAIYQTGADGAPDMTLAEGPYIYTATDAADVAANGAKIRQIETDLLFAYFHDTGAPYTPTNQAAWDAAAAVFLSDDTAQASPWSYDAFTLHTKSMTQAEAEAILPSIAPRLPGETDGDGRLVRHLTIFDVKNELRLENTPTSGFISSGNMEISDGEMTWILTLTPGRPISTASSPTPVTVGEVQSGSYGTNLAINTDPDIRVGDLAFVDS